MGLFFELWVWIWDGEIVGCLLLLFRNACGR